MIVNVNSRWQAFAIHLALSLLVLFIVSAVVLFLWYPGEFKSLGGLYGLKVIAGVDVVLGPLLTLIVFNTAKKSLKWDLSIIACMQLAALGYGLWAVQSGRPIAQVLNHKGVYIVTQTDLDYYKLDKAEFLKFGDKLPVKVFMDLPLDYQQINQIEFATEFTASKPLELRTDLYKNFALEQGHKQVDFYLKNRELNPQQGCSEVDVTSAQERLQGCIHKGSGNLTL